MCRAFVGKRLEEIWARDEHRAGEAQRGDASAHDARYAKPRNREPRCRCRFPVTRKNGGAALAKGSSVSSVIQEKGFRRRECKPPPEPAWRTSRRRIGAARRDRGSRSRGVADGRRRARIDDTLCRHGNPDVRSATRAGPAQKRPRAVPEFADRLHRRNDVWVSVTRSVKTTVPHA